MDIHSSDEQDQAVPAFRPFSEHPGESRFFPGGGRRTVLDEMTQALTGGIPILTLAGEDGSGKTVICRLLKEAMISGYATVFFQRAAESFEEVLRASARELGFAADSIPSDSPGLLQCIVSHLQTHDLRLLLIVDEAERIYLATLERIRKMMDVANQTGVHVQLVLSGTIELHHNFKNLALCNFQPAEERHFSLQPLTAEETGAYLAFVAGDQKEDLQAHFTRDIVASIFASSKGNFRLIRERADETLAGSEPDAPDIALQEKPDGDREIQEQPPRRLQRKARTRAFALDRRYFAWGGGAAAVLVAVLLLVFRGDEQPGLQQKEVSTAESNTVAETVEQKAPVAETVKEEPPVEEETPASPAPGASAMQPEPPTENASQPAENQEIVPVEQETSPAQVSQSVEEAEEPPAGPAPADILPEKEENGAAEQPVVSETPTGDAEKAAEDAEKAATAASDQAQSSVLPPVASGQEGAPGPATTGEPAQPEPQAVAADTAVEAATPAEEPEAADLQGQNTAQDVAIPVAGRPVEPPRDAQETASPPAAESAETAAQPPEQPAVSAEAAPVEQSAREEQVEPQVITAREVVKYRERIPPVTPQTISPEAAKIIRKETEQPVPAPPVVIKVDEQKKELVVQSAPPATEVDAHSEPEKSAIRAAETPKKSEGVDQIYSRRLAAGTSWVLGNKNDKYTVRLMVVTSGDAEKKLKSMLGEKRYREQADKFYILKKESNPDVQYVYYGEYPTMTAARNARNTIPEFLREYKPYAMSVKGAVERAQQDE